MVYITFDLHYQLYYYTPSVFGILLFAILCTKSKRLSKMLRRGFSICMVPSFTSLLA